MAVTITATRTQQFAPLGDTDNDGVFDPNEVIRVVLRIANSGDMAATGVTASDPFNGTTLNGSTVRITPITVDDSFNITGNTPITFTAAQLLGNDLDPLGNTATLQVTAVSGATNGTIVNNGNGTFTFTPTTGLDVGQTASFQYTITDQEGLTNVTGANGVVTLNITDVVWHVDSAYTGTNGASDGSYLRPFTSLTELNGVTGDGTTNDDVDSANEAIFINNRGTNYGAGITLEAGQRLYGDGFAVSANGIALGVSGSNATISTSGTTALTLATNNEIRGLTIAGSSGFNGAIYSNGANVGTLTISNTSVNTSGVAININNGGTLNVALDTLSSSTSPLGGVQLGGGITGSFSATTGSIVNSTGTAFVVGSGTANITYGGTIGAQLAQAVSVTGRTGGTVTFSGDISDSSASNNHISVSGNSGGTVSFNGAVNLQGTTGNLVSLTTNSGSTINFGGGGTGVDLTTTTGTGFTATGGGTVNVSGSGNTLTAGTGTALNIANTTIGSSGVTFQSISTSGAANGIILNSTGAGTFAITGTGAANSGGTIQNSTGVGISLNATGPVSLTGLTVSGGGSDGINGTNVNSLTLSGVRVLNNGNAVGERGVYINGLTGTGTITGSTFSGNFDHNVNLINNGGTLNLTVTTSTFSNSNGPNGNDGLLLESNGNAVTTAHISGSTFDNNAGDHFQFATNGTGNSQNNITFTGNTLTTSNATNILGGGVTISPSGGDDLVVAVTNNTITGTVQGAAINVVGVSTVSGGNLQATIQGNTIGTAGVANSGTSGGALGINAELNGNGTLTALINNNIVREVSGFFGIAVTGRAGTGAGGTVNATVTNNTVTATATAGLLNGINVTSGVSSGGDRETLNAQISGNTISAGLSTNIRVRALSNSTAGGLATFNLRGYTGGATDTAAVGTYVSSQNGGTTASAALLTNNTASFNNTPGGGAPALPGTPATPLLVVVQLPAIDSGEQSAPLIGLQRGLAPIEIGSGSIAQRFGLFGGGPVNGSLGVQLGADGIGQPAIADDRVLVPQHGGSEAPADVAVPGSQPASIDLTPIGAPETAILDQAALDAVVEAAIQRWIDAGATAEQIAAMRAVRFDVADLAGINLGSAQGGTIHIDSDGAGFGWFIDKTPGDDAEFSGTGTSRTGTAGAAATRIDLLTVVLHELGHAIGLEDSYQPGDSANLLYGYITPGERRLPADGQAAGAVPGSVAAEAFALAPTLIGTLPAGKSVDIFFDSTVNAVTNQVIVAPSSASSVSGGNFTTVTSNTQTLTLDTLTLSGTIFLDANRNGVLDAGEAAGTGIALTLFADTNGNNVFDGGDTQITTTTTSGAGLYTFGSLAPGNYIVRVDAANFTGAGALVGRGATLSGGDLDNNTDNDSNAGALAAGASTSQAITLAYNTEPTNGTGNDSNATLDLGFLVPNAAPSLTSVSPTPTFVENGSPVAIAPAVTLADDQANFAGGSLTVAITSGGNGLEAFGTTIVPSQTGDVQVGGVTIGVITPASGITTGAQTISIALNANATPARVSQLVQSFVTSVSGDDPGGQTRTFTFTLVDGGGTLGGGTDTTTLVRTVNVMPVDDAPVAVADTGTVNANATTNVVVLANDSDVDGPAPSLATVNGVALAPGATTTLASGAILTRNANGTLTYNPNGAFNFLVSPATAAATGAANGSAIDSFTYTLVGGVSATVSVTVNGIDEAGDQLRGDAGNNTITGTAGVDFFNLSQGGTDTVSGGGGNDAFYFGAAFGAGDIVDGGIGTNDQIALQGNYTQTFAANAFTNLEVIALLSGSVSTFGGGGGPFSYNLTTVDANVGAGQELVIYASSLVSGETFTFNGSAETDGQFRIYGGRGTDTITTGAGNDGIYFGPGTFSAATDSVNGGAGTNDQVALDGNYTVTLTSANLQNVEVLALLRGLTGDLGNYNITLADNLLATGQSFTVWGQPVETAITLNASAEASAALTVFGGTAGDTITTGGGNDTIWGGLGADVLTGGAGADTFRYTAANESTGSSFDRIIGFVSGTDRIDLPGTVSGIGSAITSGSLSTAGFDASLAATIGAGQLAANNALLYTPNAGEFAGVTFLVVDADGVAGYQAGVDFVIRLDTPPPAITTSDFI